MSRERTTVSSVLPPYPVHEYYAVLLGNPMAAALSVIAARISSVAHVMPP